MYEYGKHLLRSTYACTSEIYENTISMMKDILHIYSYEIKEICFTNQDMWNYIDSYNRDHKNVQSILNRSLYISKMLQILLLILIL